MYKVYFSDGYEITQVQDVQFGHERDIKIHDGLGQGKFPIPDSKGLKTWTIKCQQEDNALFAKLEKLLCSKEETRLVISSNAENISELVLLKSYDKQEVFSGVFNITIKFIEYVKAGIRTTDVPFIARSGKVPVPPKTVVFDGKGSTPYKAALKELKSLPHKTYAQNQVDKIYEMELVEKDTGKTVNPCNTTPEGIYIVRQREVEKQQPLDKAILDFQDNSRDWAQKTMSTMSDFFEKRKKEKEENLRKAEKTLKDYQNAGK